MSSGDPRHLWTVSDLTGIFIRGHESMVSVHNPLLLDDASMPAPDIVLLDRDAPQDQYPSPRDTYLIVEVAGYTLPYDRRVRGPLYARAGIPEHWTVDLNGGGMGVAPEPSAAGYRATRFF